MDMRPYHDKPRNRWLHLCKPVEMQIALVMGVLTCPNCGYTFELAPEDKPQWATLDPDDTK